jgi:hypothetical protein
MTQTTLERYYADIHNLITAKEKIDVSDIAQLNGFVRYAEKTIRAWVALVWDFCLSEENNNMSRFVSYVASFIKPGMYAAGVMDSELVNTMMRYFMDVTTMKVYDENGEYIIVPVYPSVRHSKIIDKYPELQKQDRLTVLFNEANEQLANTYREVYLQHIEYFKRKYGYDYSDILKWTATEVIEFFDKVKSTGVKLSDIKKTENYIERPAHRPAFGKKITMINVATNEEYKVFSCREEAINELKIAKTRLSQCLSSTTVDDKSNWSKYRYNKQWYWLIEEA